MGNPQKAVMSSMCVYRILSDLPRQHFFLLFGAPGNLEIYMHRSIHSHSCTLSRALYVWGKKMETLALCSGVLPLNFCHGCFPSWLFHSILEHSHSTVIVSAQEESFKPAVYQNLLCTIHSAISYCQ